jgi:DNA-binding CsgD family transcriptional regulator
MWMTSWSVATGMVVLTQLLTLDPAAAGTVAAVRVRATELAWLVGVFRACHRAMGVCVERVPMMVLGVRRATQAATAIIGATDFAAAEERGGRFRPGSDMFQQYVQSRWPVRPVDGSAPVLPEVTGWNGLSPAEREVAVLAAAGWPNSGIAERRGSSVRTVGAQVASIRQKLLISSRRDIPRYVPAELAETVDLERTAAAGRRRDRRVTRARK